MVLEINDHVETQRWLIDNGFINDLHKDNLFAYGSLVHKDIIAVEARINVETKVVDYDLYVSSVLLRKIHLFEELSKSKSIIDLWRFRRLLRKEGNLNFWAVLNRFVKTYLGQKWNVQVNLKDIKDYEEGFNQNTAVSFSVDQPVNAKRGRASRFMARLFKRSPV